MHLSFLRLSVKFHWFVNVISDILSVSYTSRETTQGSHVGPSHEDDDNDDNNNNNSFLRNFVE